MKKFLASLWREIDKPILSGILALLIVGGLVARCKPEISKEEQIGHQLKYFQDESYVLTEYQENEKFFMQVELQEIPELKMELVLVARKSDNVLFCALAPSGAKFEIGEEVSLRYFMGRKTFYGAINEFAVVLPK